jgi:hypothetical protein
MTVALAICTALTLTGCADPGGGFPDAPPTTAAPAIDTVDWASAVVEIPVNQTGCAAGEADFAAGRATVGGTPYQMFVNWAPAPLYADFDHDGRTDAVIAVACVRRAGLRNPPYLLLAINGAEDRHPMGTLFSSKPRNPDGEGASFTSELHLEEDGAVRYIDRTYEGNLGCAIEWTWMSGDFIHRSVDDSPVCSR